MNLDECLDIEESRAVAYKCLSTCYYLPEQATLALLVELEVALSKICPVAAANIAPMRQETDLEQLKIDFSQLFVGPFKLIAPPYGSVYLEGQRAVMGASTIDAEKRYRVAGLDISSSLNDAPDHIAVELEFVYFLVFKQIEAARIGQPDDAYEWRQRQNAFLPMHLGAWVAVFAAAVEQGATTDFYRYLARATREFVHSDQEFIAGTMQEKPQPACNYNA